MSDLQDVNGGPVLPLHMDGGVLSLPVDEEFHRAKLINFLANNFKGLVLNGAIDATALGIINEVIRQLLGIHTNTAYQQAHDLHIFEQLCLQLLKDEMKSSGTQSEGFAMKICQASRWITDEEFGRQILNGVNPVLIRKCSALPKNFRGDHEVINAIEKLLVRNTTLDEEMKVCT